MVIFEKYYEIFLYLNLIYYPETKSPEKKSHAMTIAITRQRFCTYHFPPIYSFSTNKLDTTDNFVDFQNFFKN